MRLFLHSAVAVVLAGGLLAGCADGGDVDDGETTIITDDGETEAVVTDDDDDVEVRIVAPEDGAVVNSPFTVEFEADGIDIGPADEGEGNHFHLIVDDGCVVPGEVVPNDDTHLHFGEGQNETQLELALGTHELCVQVADGDHVATADTDTIEVHIEE